MDLHTPPDFSRDDASTQLYKETFVNKWEFLDGAEQSSVLFELNKILDGTNASVQPLCRIYQDSFYRRNGFRLMI